MAQDTRGPGGGSEGAGGGRLGYEVIVVTRNRPEALALSIPLLLAQSRPPERLTVVDASDDHDATRRAVDAAAAGATIPVETRRGPTGMTRQRNAGLARVEAPIVMFPDDDSLTHQGSCEAIMRAFERDREGQVAAVNAADAPEPPPEAVEALRAAGYAVSAEHQAKAGRARALTRAGRRAAATNPRMALGEVVLARAPDLPWLAEARCVPVPWLTGYRNMSFRVDVLRRVGGFEEAFGHHALFEDTDASFAVARHGTLLGVDAARVHHHRFPSGRGSRHAFAVMNVLNMAFVLAKHAHGLGLDARERARVAGVMRRHAALRMAVAAARGVRDRGAREELRGVRDAWGPMTALLGTPPEALARTYAEAARRLGIEGVPEPKPTTGAATTA